MNIKNLYILFLLFIFIGGCSSKDKKTVLLWVNNYDITSVDVRIEQIFTTNGEASIVFTYEGQEYLLSFVLVKYSGGWYISDSIYDRFQIALRNK